MPPTRQRLRFCTGVVTLLVLAATAAGAATPGPRPNLLLISIDSLRRDLLGCYGAALPYAAGVSPSPHLDRLAREGVRLADAYAPSPWTLPSHASLMTGLTPMVHGVETDLQTLDARQGTIASVLKANGYQTVGVFSGPYLEPYWGFGNGFDRYTAAYGSSVAAASGEIARVSADIARANAGGDAATAEALLWERRKAYQRVRELSHADVSAERVTHAALDELGTLAAASAPWFLFVHYFDVHYDYVPPAPFLTRFDPHYEGAMTGRNFLQNPLVAVANPAFANAWSRRASPRDTEHLLALCAGEVAWVDAHVGRVLAKLAALAQDRRTLVVVISDHGDEFFEHGGIGHRHTLHEELVRIPLLLRMPGVLPAGATVSGRVSLTDVYPTVLDLLDLPSPGAVTGRTMVPLVRGIDDGEVRVQFSRLVRLFDGSVDLDGKTLSVQLATVQEAFWYDAIKVFRTRHWPLFPPHLPESQRTPLRAAADQEFRTEELGWIDLTKDPTEPTAAISRNFDDPRARAALEAFRTRYRALRARGRAIQHSRIDEATRGKLEGLGYVVPAVSAPQSPRHGFTLPPPGDVMAPAPR